MGCGGDVVVVDEDVEEEEEEEMHFVCVCFVGL